MLKLTTTFSVLATVLLAGCGGMADKELVDCLQPNRRVEVELVGRRPAPKPKVKPGQPAPKPSKKPRFLPVQLKGYAQGNLAFDPGQSVLKDGGKQDLDRLLAQAKKQRVTIDAVILSGHIDRLEESDGGNALAEARAKSVLAYLTSKGVDQKVVFWEGKGAKQPAPVTKFCGE